MKLRLGLYGHSACASDSRTENSYQKMITDHYNGRLEICNIGAAQASEERLLFELKKTKPDVAVIFHSRPQSTFIPNCNRDLATADNPWKKAIHIWETEGIDGINREWFTNPGGIKRVFPDPETFVQTVSLYKRYLWHPDLEKNRFDGALLAIDRWCKAKQPHVLHCISDVFKPVWFEFESGKRDRVLEKLTETQGLLSYPNNMTKEQNYDIFCHLRDTLIDPII